MRRRRFLEALTAVTTAPWVGCDKSETTAAPPAAPVVLEKPPWLQVAGARSVRLRFETLTEQAIPVVVTRDGGSEDHTPTLETRDVTYARNFLDASDEFFPDEPGQHTVQEVILDGLEPGARYGYRVEADEPVEGSFLAPPSASTALRIGWLSDTSWPFSRDAVALLEAEPVDLLLHGGDLQYQASPLDTWNGMARSLQGVMSRALAHMVVGNHEFEDGDEIEQMYDRLYGGQGEPTPDAAARYFALTFGGIRVVCLDTETGDLATDAAQLAWLDDELAAASSSGDIAQTIVAFHRPVYSLSKHFPDSTATRDALHARLTTHGVGLVMMGHAHCYERFVVDGIHYVVDGGGGALPYDPNEDREKADMLRPGESDLRVAVAESFGATMMDLRADGTLAVTRKAMGGAVDDTFELPPG